MKPSSLTRRPMYIASSCDSFIVIVYQHPSWTLSVKLRSVYYIIKENDMHKLHNSIKSSICLNLVITNSKSSLLLQELSILQHVILCFCEISFCVTDQSWTLFHYMSFSKSIIMVHIDILGWTWAKKCMLYNTKMNDEHNISISQNITKLKCSYNKI